MSFRLAVIAVLCGLSNGCVGTLGGNAALRGDGDPGDVASAGDVGDGHTSGDSEVCTVGDAPGAAFGLELFVSPLGADSNQGGINDPFLTLGRARDAVRAVKTDSGLPEGGVVIWLRQGEYEFSTTLELGVQDSGEMDRPVVYSAYPCEEVRLVGSKRIEPSWFETVEESSDVWNRVDPVARGHLHQVDLGAHGIADYGQFAKRGFGATHVGALELFFNTQPMTLGRWPDPDQDDRANESTHEDEQVLLYGEAVPNVTGTYIRNGTQDGVNAFARQELVDGKQYYLYRRTWDYDGNTHTAWFITTGESGYPGNQDPWWSRYNLTLGSFNPSNGASGNPDTHNSEGINMGFASIRAAVSDTEFGYYGSRPERWLSAEDPWAHGFWFHMWADRHMPIASIDTAAQTISFAEIPGYGIKEGQPYYAWNLLEEITVPGEWYLNRSTGILYFWPPQPLASSEIRVAMLETPLLKLTDAAWVTLRNLTFEMTRGTLVEIQGGDHNAIESCTLRNAGTTAVTLNGSNSRVDHCLIHATGDHGIILGGGNRASLIAGGNSLTHCDIHNFGRWTWTYKAAVSVTGVGQRVANNHFYQAPHSAIFFSGNNHLIELNEIHDVCRFSSDAGAIYSGRHWDFRGNEIRHNFIHDVASSFEGFGVHGVYQDDCLAGVHVHGNVFYRITGHAIQHGGGRDSIMENNVAARCGDVVASDSRGLTRINNIPGDSWNLLERLGNEGVQYQEEPWASAYPKLFLIPNDWSIISNPDNEWLYPQGSVFSRNVGFANDRFARESNGSGTGTFNKFAEMIDNLEDVDPLFVDEESLDLRLRPESPAFDIPGFQAIPFEEIGPH